jgi:hypothetical protein
MKPLKKVYRGLPARRSLVAMLTLIVACSLSNARAQNTATGVTALTNVTPAGTSGTNNTADGAYALKDDTTGSYNLDIDDFGADTSSDTNTIRIGNASYENAAFIAGIRGITTGASDAVEVLIDSNGQLGTISSSRRYKQDITDMGDASSRLLRLRPVTFRYKKPFKDGSKPIQYGLVAEEVAQVFPELAVFNAKGQPETVKYHLLAPLLLNEFLKEHKSFEEQGRTLAAQEQAIARQDRINARQDRINAEQQEKIEALTASVEKVTQQIQTVAQRLNGSDYEPAVNRVGE